MSESHRREADLFDAVLELPPSQRATHLDQACGDDAALRQRIEALLQASESLSEFVDPLTDPALSPALHLAGPLPERPGDRISHYKLLQQIGEGGCGVVYMAEQEEPVSRRVALKVIKLGMDTRSVIARFEAERQALAMMDHANIARVFDAGATETGRPFFVMELVRGVKITDYCDERQLSPRARLELFMQVCSAVQHAHQKGIIHRDLKPSNILVTVNDGVPVPKIIDFGIAKATGGQKLTGKTLFTAFEQFIGTPAYMSPEQAMLTSLDIDTRSDIYALGVVLYELLTGRTPFDPRELMTVGLDAMRRTICETDPPRPSTRLSTLPGQDLSTAAQRRGLDAPRLLSQLRGELDWIVMKCLEKDRARRYETASGLAADIQRHLDHEPVMACPPSRLYRLKKWVQRNKFAFAAGCAVLASLAIGLALSSASFLRERAAREEADTQVSITSALNDFLLHDLLGQVTSEAQARKGFAPNPNVTVREALERAAERIEERFQGQPQQEAAVRLEIGEALWGLRQSGRAIPHLERAVELYKATLGATHASTLSAMGVLARAYSAAGQHDRSLALYEETLKLMTASLGLDDPRTREVMGNMAMAYAGAGQNDRATAMAEEAVRWSKASLGPGDRRTLGAMNNLGSFYRSAGKLDQAQSILEEALGAMRAGLPAGDPWMLNAIANLASCYRDADKLDKALPLLEEVLGLRRATLGPEDPQTMLSMGELARAYRDTNRLQQALPLFEEALKLMRARLGTKRPSTQSMMHDLADCYRDAGMLDKALPLFEELMTLRKAELGPGSLEAVHAMCSLAETYALARKLGKAEAVYREAIEKLRPASGGNAPEEAPILGFMLHHLADALRERKALDEARGHAEEAATLYDHHPDWPTRERLHAYEVLARVLEEIGDARGAASARLKQGEALRAAADEGDLDALNNLAWILSTSRDPATRDGSRAVTLAERAAAKTGRKNPGILDTLAAAYAEAGEFARAVDAEREAIRLCGDEAGKEQFTARLKLYESSSPLRDP